MDFLYSSIAVCIFSTSCETLVSVLPMLATVWNKEDDKNLSLPQTSLPQSFNC